MRNIFITMIIFFVFSAMQVPYVCAQEQSQTQAQQETPQGPALTDKPLEVWTFIDDYRVITGKTIHLTVQLIWKLGITMNLEGIDKINLLPFRIEGVTIGERQIFDNEHDYLVITYTLTLPSTIKDGIYSLPSFSLSYQNEVDKSEGIATSSPVVIKKVPIMVEGKVDKDVITLGDRIHYSLIIRHEKNVKLIGESIEKLSFSPFEVLNKEVESQPEGDIEKIHINYTLSLYELAGAKKTPEIPALFVLYYVEPPHSDKVRVDSSIETKEVKTAPVPIILNSLLKAVDVPLEGLKGPLYYSKKDIFYHSYLPAGLGIGLIVFLGVITLRSTVRKLTPDAPKRVAETPELALKKLRDAIASFQFTDDNAINQKHIQNIDKTIRIYLGVLTEIPGDTAQSVTTADFFSQDTQKKLSEEVQTSAKTLLKQLDALIFGRRIDKESVDKMLLGIEAIITLTNPL
ncbi:MAG TPA: hypothetical protein ACFYDZ_03810 [Candidatus Brocadiaceae bacterium]